MEWQDRETVKKGDLGEEIVSKYFDEKGYVIYKPISNRAHGFDRLVSHGKDRFVIVEVKTKAKRNSFPDTGINYKHYLEYRKISEKHNLPVFIYFVDEMLGQIYGGELDKLEIPDCYEFNGKNFSYPLIEQYDKTKIIYFYQPTMNVIKELTPEQIEHIKSFSTRNHDYKKLNQPIKS